MPRNSAGHDPVLERLDAILAVVQDLFILRAKEAGLARDQIRSILGVDNNRISHVTKHLGRAAKASD